MQLRTFTCGLSKSDFGIEKSTATDGPTTIRTLRQAVKIATFLPKLLARQADDIIEEHDKDIALLSMEGLDAGFANKIQQLMKHPERTKVFTSSDYNASQMTSILRSLDLLITSRYHAGVLSLASQVPQVAIGHDLRIRDLYTDLEMSELFTDHEDDLMPWELSNDVERCF